ncbi:hypothetical protein [Pontibacter flavimaris]|nr:hypothetical protein [Pontibacter flavimaris]
MSEHHNNSQRKYMLTPILYLRTAAAAPRTQDDFILSQTRSTHTPDL